LGKGHSPEFTCKRPSASIAYLFCHQYYRYDNVYDEDLPGFLGIKTYFWDSGEPGVEAYLRRRTLDGDWVWMVAKVIDYIDHPVQGMIAQEEVATDEESAKRINGITRISSLLLQAIEAAKATEPKKTHVNDQIAALLGSFANTEIPLVAADAAAYQALLRQASGTLGLGISPNDDSMQEIMLAASTGGAVNFEKPEALTDDPIKKLKNELMQGDSSIERKGFDPLSALKAVRTGVVLDLGMVNLSEPEVKMITLVLTGRLTIQDIGPLLYKAFNSPGQDLASALMDFQLDCERQPGPILAETNATHRHGTSTRRGHSSARGRSPQHPGSSSFLLPSPMHEDPFQSSFNNLFDSPIPNYMEPTLRSPAPISVINLSYTYMGNMGMEMLSEIIYLEDSVLQTLDVSFCCIDEKGILAFSRALARRKRKNIPPLRGLVMSGNYISYRSAKELGQALSPGDQSKSRKRTKVFKSGSTGYDEDHESDDEDCDDDDEVFGSDSARPRKRTNSRVVKSHMGHKCCSQDHGLQVFHLGSSSLSGDSLYQLLRGLGPHSPVKELSIPSNKIGPTGATQLVEFLESKGAASHVAMPFLDRLDLSNNDLGNDGTARLTRAIAKRIKIHFVDLRLSNNDIGSSGVETIMNKLLQHNLVSLSLDNNAIGDQGCQLVAASLHSMHQLSRLNLSFNQIGSRGCSTLMKTLIGCESITYLGLSGNIMKISGAIAMGFTLAQHPRLEELDLDNCCLSQAAQCHIVAGIISNRWVPMKRMKGFQAGPPMVAIGSLEVYAHNLSNEECFRIRRDEQMKTILQWMESNRAARQNGQTNAGGGPGSQEQYLTPDFVSTVNEVHGTPSQNAYLRMLGWLSKIPFDEDELTTLRKYFYDSDGGEGDRGSDGYINLKLRGDLLAALDSGIADEIRDQSLDLGLRYRGSVGLDLSTMVDVPTTWETLRGVSSDSHPSQIDRNEYVMDAGRSDRSTGAIVNLPTLSEGSSDNVSVDHSRKRRSPEDNGDSESASDEFDMDYRNQSARSSFCSNSRQSMTRSDSERSMRSNLSQSERKSSKIKARITMFPPFEAKLEELKAMAKEMMEHEDDPEQQDIILTQYAEASLTILRQLRYHCMNSGLDGWRQGKLKRKVLIVDDSLVTRKMVARAFEKANFIVDTAENGVEGVKKLKESIYDIAFMDIDMPVMNGFEATKALRQWEDISRPGARQPICALTAAYVDDFERSELMKFKEAGLDVMESKPCNIPRLFKVVDDVSPMFSDLSISVSQSSTTY
jgi:CheY-like chemotaxis protein